ncbi:hypothetical protein [Allorhodopirellula heiligendammensis]|uniref:Knr4/Smi1-like domain-containing protein n=1 Tax=Allorhodopirellula heiligendammensis TaxID=2714739 RepID=A0A5C6C5Y4_9BACT|nr:hypothetical protein [Allorhodopirellula heiligendammensis]TWU20040.1 hypothetical protein Poly21_22200 [Allorhodopirellula heiligendammensis]
MIAELVAIDNPNAHKVNVNEAAVSFLNGNGLPQQIVESITEFGYDDWMSLRHFSIAPVNQLESLNTEELYLPWYVRRYLTIAGGLNGDPVAIDLDSFLMCFIFHDEMYPRQSFIPDDFVLHTSLTYFDFWMGVVSDPNFPVDAYDAEERWGRLPRFQTKAEQ